MTHAEYLAERASIDAMYAYDSEVLAYQHSLLDRRTPLNVIHPSLAHNAPASATAAATSPRKDPIAMELTDQQERTLHAIAVKYADHPAIADNIKVRLMEEWSKEPEPGMASVDFDKAVRAKMGDFPDESPAEALRLAQRSVSYANVGDLSLAPDEALSAAELLDRQRANDPDKDTAAQARAAEDEARMADATEQADAWEAANPGEGVSVERGNLKAQKARLEADKTRWTQARLTELQRQHPEEEFVNLATAADADFKAELRAIDQSISAVNASLSPADEGTEGEEAPE